MKNTSEHLFEYCLRLGDTPLILGQRLAEWCGHGPILEEDIAMTNISLDCIGQARAFLTYAGEIEGKDRTEDDLAYFRNEREFRNLLITEQPNEDFAQTMLRQFLISAFHKHFYSELMRSADKTLSALAEKSLKEVNYHFRHSSEWLKRFGNGTEESRTRLMNAMDNLWRYTGDMFDMDETDKHLVECKIAADLDKIKTLWNKSVEEVFSEAGIDMPKDVFMMSGSRKGKHTEHLGHILAEMQSLARSFPGASW
ncbi:MAG: phenylacetate-CoA oxygenase subunit PaaI [Bacteroidetes bacterium]|nr:MAG: phenylacetate-CoA oxygenase subunit PaaI [Bacteroidota bacterium]REK05032.1 MAG: phenylacetate-CoA oxygenase subunit PaaI [Bacteroidota bacterium]REK36465.1 MAG: phenylacetate-CoA oxygenase subunit PaaI [Bacteroidota bacterium]REK51679.1 MAG: phenylacetate-CoA oxygenase subunit PaaI [Bacteroidota bacterium]